MYQVQIYGVYFNIFLCDIVFYVFFLNYILNIIISYRISVCFVYNFKICKKICRFFYVDKYNYLNNRKVCYKVDCVIKKLQIVRGRDDGIKVIRNKESLKRRGSNCCYL